MKTKKYINSIIEFKLKGRKTPIKGVLIDYSKNWTYLYNNPQDYILDGFILIRNDLVEKHRQITALPDSKIMKEKVKKIKYPSIDLKNLESMVMSLTKKDIIISIEELKGKSCLIGKAEQFNNAMKIKTINPKAKWDKTYPVKNSDIKIVEFGTDYINSLLLAMKS